MSHFTVIGLGRFGITACKELVHLGHTVTGVDISDKIADKYTEELTHTVICDATDERALKELNLANSSAVLIAIGEDMQASLLCTLHLKNLGVSEIWVKANTSAHHTILSKLNVSRIVHPEEEMGVRVAHALNYPIVNNYLSIGHGNYVVEVSIIAKLDGKSLQKILTKHIHKIDILMIQRGNVVHKAPTDEFEVKTGDVVLFCGSREALKKTAPLLG